MREQYRRFTLDPAMVIELWGSAGCRKLIPLPMRICAVRFRRKFIPIQRLFLRLFSCGLAPLASFDWELIVKQEVL
jgi:hypothetical protein